MAQVKDEGVGLWILLRSTSDDTLFFGPALDYSPRSWKFELEVLIILKPWSLLVLLVLVHLLEKQLGDPVAGAL